MYSNQVKIIAKRIQDLGGVEGLLLMQASSGQRISKVLPEHPEVSDEAAEEEYMAYIDQVDYCEPFMLICNTQLRDLWRKNFLSREEVAWEDFWGCFAQKFGT